MDPVSLFGVLAGAFQIAQLIGTTIQTLHTLKGKFKDADLTIPQVIGQLSTIEAVISQIQDWAEYNAEHSPKVQQYMKELETSLDGCWAAMLVLADDVGGLSSVVSFGSMTIGARTQFVWNDGMMKEHQGRLAIQVQALQLLLTASQ